MDATATYLAPFLVLLIPLLVIGVLLALVFLVLLLRRPKPQLDTLPFQLAISDVLTKSEQNLRADFNSRLDATRNTLDARLDRLAETLIEKLGHNRKENAELLEHGHNATRTLFAEFQVATEKVLHDARQRQNQQLAEFGERLAQLQKITGDSLSQTRTEQATAAESMRKTVEERLKELTTQNAAKLDEMRQTVDEKLQTTLEKRLGESFKLVGDNLEKVIKSMAEMQAVAADVGDLKRVLTNVKERGTWGEMQLANLLESFLQADQYDVNVKPNPRSDKIVEFAVKLPGGDESNKPLWLPIDSKFPREDYERLADAAEKADSEGVEQASKALAGTVETFARDIRDKYIVPPHTTDFAIMFLPTEGLYAEVLRRAGLVDRIQREHRVLIAGPTTLAALLNSLQMGFRTLAIQKRSADVWKTLRTVKTQLDIFGKLLDSVQKRLDQAGRAVGDAANRHRIMTKRLANVEALPVAEDTTTHTLTHDTDADEQ